MIIILTNLIELDELNLILSWGWWNVYGGIIFNHNFNSFKPIL